MKKIKCFIATVIGFFILSSCQKLDELPLGDQNSMIGFRYFVYQLKNVEGQDGSPVVYERKEYSVTVPDNGNINIYPSDSRENLKNVRLEAIIPGTARIEERDNAGVKIADGIGGRRDVYGQVYYFYVVAANGLEKKYTVKFNKN